MNKRANDHANMVAVSPRLKTTGYILATLIVLVVSRLYFVLTYSDASPFWDEWDAVFDAMLMPLARGDFHWSTLFAAHNEHRILFSRLIVLGLIDANNGQFDGRVECVFNILLAAGAAWVFLSAVIRHVPMAVRGAFAVIVAIALAIPYAWENIIGGFQSQFYLLAAFSTGCVWVASASRLGIRGVAALFTLTLCAIFSMASGVLAAIAVILIVAIRRLDGSLTPRSTTLTAVSQGLLVVVGFALIPHTNAEANHAQNVGELISALRILFSWPFRPNWVSAIVLWLPALGLAVRFARESRRRRLAIADHLLLGLIVWVGLQMGAMGYSRGHGMMDISARYLDIVILGVLTNIAVLLHLTGTYARLRVVPALVAIGLYAGWIAFALLGTYTPAVANMGGRHAGGVRTTDMMRAYLASGDAKVFDRQPGTFAYPDTGRVMRSLDDPAFAGLMPAAIRLPIPITWRSCSGFVDGGAYSGMPPMDGAPTRGSWTPASANANTGRCESATFAVRTPYVSFWTAGYPVAHGNTDLTLLDSRGKERSVVRHAPRESWVLSTARIRGEQTLIAKDVDPTTWMAFSAPIETGRLTAAVGRLDREFPTFAAVLAALALAILITTSLLAARRRDAP